MTTERADHGSMNRARRPATAAVALVLVVMGAAACESGPDDGPAPVSRATPGVTTAAPAPTAETPPATTDTPATTAGTPATPEPSGAVANDLGATTAVAPAPDGGAWLATRAGGLVRVGADGDNHQRHLTERLAGRRVTALAVSDDGTVWAASRPSDLGRQAPRVVRYHDGTATTYTAADGLGEGPVSALAVDDDGVVWAGTGAGVVRFDGRRWAAVASPFDEPPSPVHVLAVASDGAVWAATRRARLAGAEDDEGPPGGRVARFDGGSWQTWHLGGELPGVRISALAAGGDGSVWMATRWQAASSEEILTRALLRFTGDGWAVQARDSELSGTRLETLAVDGDGRVWLPVGGAASDATPTPDGVARFADGALARLPTGERTAPGAISDLAIGRGGAVWAATDRGVARFDARR